MKKKFNKVSVVGLGYIGLPTAAVLASRGIEVVGVDINPQAVETINSGGIHIVEPGLDVVVRGVVNSGNLRATTQAEPADAFLIAVPTPFKDNYEPDLSYVKAATESIAPVLKKGDLLILESTSPVGTTDQMCEWLKELRPDLSLPCGAGETHDIHMAYCPERVLPGKVIRELTENDRVVGGMTPQCAEMACDLYKIFVNGECIPTNSRTAEMTKLTENAFRDVNIAFANEISMICDKLEINPWELISLANRHPRVNILNPGPGVGGHCISIDPWFIVAKNPEEARLIRTSRQVNDSKPEYVVSQINEMIESKGVKKLACFGLAFKANIDDLRESPALNIVEKVAAGQKVEIMAVEPFVEELPKSLRSHSQVRLVSELEALEQADAFVFLVDHSSFKELDFKLVKSKPFIDTRGLFQ